MGYVHWTLEGLICSYVHVLFTCVSDRKGRTQGGSQCYHGMPISHTQLTMTVWCFYRHIGFTDQMRWGVCVVCCMQLCMRHNHAFCKQNKTQPHKCGQLDVCVWLIRIEHGPPTGSLSPSGGPSRGRWRLVFCPEPWLGAVHTRRRAASDEPASPVRLWEVWPSCNIFYSKGLSRNTTYIGEKGVVSWMEKWAGLFSIARMQIGTFIFNYCLHRRHIV